MLGEWVRRLAKESALVIKFILAMVVTSSQKLEISSFFQFLSLSNEKTTMRKVGVWVALQLFLRSSVDSYYLYDRLQKSYLQKQREKLETESYIYGFYTCIMYGLLVVKIKPKQKVCCVCCVVVFFYVLIHRYVIAKLIGDY